jgi:hypothetical protein
MRRARTPAALAITLAAVVLGCSKSEPEEAPVACLEGPGVYLQALRAAPGEVRLQDETPISDCLTQGQGGGELAEVGATMITVATRLNEEARSAPRSRRTVQLGYLIGAAERGAEDTSGIHQDLILRLNTAARFSPSGRPSPEFRRTFERGREAGRETG